MFARQALVVLFAAALGLSVTAAPKERDLVEQDPSLFIPAARIDNGLGELPPFETWTYTWLYSTPAASRDDGLGELPPYSEWRYPWVYAMPAEKIDSGLGEIRPITVTEKLAPTELRIQ